jgi:hypothetical protein
MMVLQGGRCGIYGANCSEWIIAMEVLQSLSIASFNKVHTHFSCYIYLENKLDLIWTLNIFETSKAHCVFFYISSLPIWFALQFLSFLCRLAMPMESTVSHCMTHLVCIIQFY